MTIYTRIELKALLSTSAIGVNGKIAQGKFKSLSSDTINSIIYHTPNVTSGQLTERIFWILNDITTYPKYCKYPECSNPITQFKQQQYQRDFCCCSCNSKYQLMVSPNPFSGEVGINRRKKGMITKYGVEHNMQTTDSLNKRVQTYIERYGVDHPNKSQELQNIRRKRAELKGEWIPLDQLDPYLFYCRMVWKFTNQQNINSLHNSHLRGHSRDQSAFSLDHKFSIKAGFLQNIPPFIIGHISNLEFIPNKENSRKRDKCSVSLENLIGIFYRSPLSVDHSNYLK